MENIKNKLQELLSRSEWTEEERRWLLEYLEATPGGELRDLMEAAFRKDGEGRFRVRGTEDVDDLRMEDVDARRMDGVDARRMEDVEKLLLKRIHENMKIGRVVPMKAAGAGNGRVWKGPVWMRRMAAAAVIFLFILAGYRVWNGYSKKQVAGKDVLPKSERVAAGVVSGKPSDKPVLTLGDGTAVVLDDEKNGSQLQQGGTRIVKLDGKLAYQGGGDAAGMGSGNAAGQGQGSGNTGNQLLYNTLATPRGRQYEVVLPDGTLVLLDAASSIRFPTAFTGKERRVEITGEAYFEVAKNAEMPFVVNVRHSEVQVLGTSFNISAYEDEPLLKTTLLEGSVRFVASPGGGQPEGNTRLLRPGQQTQLARDGKIRMVNKIDINEVMAWKNGLFHFDGQEIQSVMNQLSRWYDIEIVYENKKPVDLFSADIPRSTSLPDLLKALELTRKVKFRMEGKKVVVME